MERAATWKSTAIFSPATVLGIPPLPSMHFYTTRDNTYDISRRPTTGGLHKKRPYRSSLQTQSHFCEVKSSQGTRSLRKNIVRRSGKYLMEQALDQRPQTQHMLHPYAGCMHPDDGEEDLSSQSDLWSSSISGFEWSQQREIVL